MEPALEPLYSMTTLQRNPTLVKQQAKDNMARIAGAVGRGIADIEEGRYTTSVEEALRNAAKLRLADE